MYGLTVVHFSWDNSMKDMLNCQSRAAAPAHEA